MGRVCIVAGVVLAATACRQPDARAAELGPSGGAIASSDGKARLELPAGALTATVRLSIGVDSRPAPPGAVGTVYELGPDGTAFAAPAMVMIALEGEPLVDSAGDPLVVARIEGETLVPLTDAFHDEAGARVGGLTRHLSRYVKTRALAKKLCKCDTRALEPCCRLGGGGQFSAAGESSDGLAEVCTCVIAGERAFERTWADYTCAREAGAHYDGSCAPCAEECCRSAGGYLLYNGPEACICSNVAAHADCLRAARCESKPIESQCPCGNDGQRCCDGACRPGLTCSGGSCVACGGPGQSCCGWDGGAGSCNDDRHDCRAGACQACGVDGLPCCSRGAPCAGAGQCVTGSCQAPCSEGLRCPDPSQGNPLVCKRPDAQDCTACGAGCATGFCCCIQPSTPGPGVCNLGFAQNCPAGYVCP